MSKAAVVWSWTLILSLTTRSETHRDLYRLPLPMFRAPLWCAPPSLATTGIVLSLSRLMTKSEHIIANLQHSEVIRARFSHSIKARKPLTVSSMGAFRFLIPYLTDNWSLLSRQNILFERPVAALSLYVLLKYRRCRKVSYCYRTCNCWGTNNIW
jgi:hypothetical protein